MTRLRAAGVAAPRPALEGANAVTLTTVHASKGLEWPFVIIPSLARAPRNDTNAMALHEDHGVGFTPGGQSPADQPPGLVLALKQARAAAEREEARRVLYVALTRARDRLLLVGGSSDNPEAALNLLRPGLEAAGVTPEDYWATPADTLPVTPPPRDRPDAPPDVDERLLQPQATPTDD